MSQGTQHRLALAGASRLLLCSFLLIAACRAHAQSIPDISLAPPPAPATRPALSFSFSEGVGYGDAIYVPVTTLGKERLFLLDTGASFSCFDSALAPQLTTTGSRGTISVPSGSISDIAYLMPAMEIQGRRLPVNGFRAISTDLQSFRLFTARPVEGILGYDVLRHYVLILDFRRRVVTLMEPEDFTPPPPPPPPGATSPGVPSTGATSFPLQLQSDFPTAKLPLLGMEPRLFLLDTGDLNCFAFLQGSVGEELAPFLLAQRTTVFSDAGVPQGTDANSLHLRRPWTFGATRYDDLWITDGTPRHNLLGLAFFRDFITTCDFPHNRVYFESIRPAHESFRDFGLSFKIEQNHLLVRHVDPPASGLDIQAGDEPVEVNGKAIAGRAQWQVINELLSVPSPTVTFRRKNALITVKFPPESAPTTQPATRAGSATAPAPSR